MVCRVIDVLCFVVDCEFVHVVLMCMFRLCVVDWLVCMGCVCC